MIRYFKALTMCLVFIILILPTVLIDFLLFMFEDFELTFLLKSETIDKVL